MLVFVEDAPETVVPVYVKAGVDVGRGRVQGSKTGDT